MKYIVTDKDPEGCFKRTVNATTKSEALVTAFHELGYTEEDIALDSNGEVWVSESWLKTFPYPVDYFDMIPVEEEDNDG